MADTARRQLTLSGRGANETKTKNENENENAIEAARAAAFYSLILREGFDAERLASERPDIAGCLAAVDLKGSTLHGRSLAYFREIERVNIEAAFRRVRSPVLALQGENDWVVADNDLDRIASFCEAAGDAAACLLPGVDHDFQQHPSLEASYANRGRGEADRPAGEATIAWMQRRP